MKHSLTATIAIALIAASATSLAAPVPVPEGISRRAPVGLGTLFAKSSPGRLSGAGSLSTKSDPGSSSSTPVGNNTPGGSHSPSLAASRPSSPPPSGSPSNSMGSAGGSHSPPPPASRPSSPPPSGSPSNSKDIDEAERIRKANVDQQNVNLWKEQNAETKSNNARVFAETKAQNRKTLALGAVTGTAAVGMLGVNVYNSRLQTVQADRANALASAAPASNSTASHRRSFIDLYYTN